MQIKDSVEKNRFFSQLNNRLENFPDEICKNKILPLIITSLEFGDASANILELLFKVIVLFTYLISSNLNSVKFRLEKYSTNLSIKRKWCLAF